ncbi:hypothetical protein QAD02_007608 [Eretmocerus hayati]|uniref:Uncharacterized protein n=1 Tax=Eretmocerus hayati TaxID=131215 RepID=A0ACC2N4F3_9HYME|nr:hypothetical protein QAD02_007608 [Eretmocerus hayati]
MDTSKQIMNHTNNISSENFNNVVASTPEVKLTCRESKHLKKLENAANLTSFVRTDSLLPTGPRKLRRGVNPNGHPNQLEKLIVDKNSGKILFPTTRGQMVQNLVQPATATTTSASLSQEQQIPAQNKQVQFIPILDIAKGNSHRGNMNLTIHPSASPENFILLFPQNQDVAEHAQKCEHADVDDISKNFQIPRNNCFIGRIDENNDEFFRDDTVLINDENGTFEQTLPPSYTTEKVPINTSSSPSIKMASEKINESRKKQYPVNVTESADQVPIVIDEPFSENSWQMCIRLLRLLLNKVEMNNQMLKDIDTRLKNGCHNTDIVDEMEDEDIDVTLDWPLQSYADLTALKAKLETDKKFRRCMKNDPLYYVRLITDQATEEFVWIQPHGKNKKKRSAKNRKNDEDGKDEKDGENGKGGKTAKKPTCHKLYIMKVIRDLFLEKKEDKLETPCIKAVLKDWVTRSSDRLRAAKLAAAKAAAKANTEENEPEQHSGEDDSDEDDISVEDDDDSN